MLDKKNLAQRVRKSKTRNVTTVHSNFFDVSGTDKTYHVSFSGNSALCNDEHGQYCNGNTRSVCYHVFAALVERAKNAEKTIAFCANRADAKRLSRLGGTFHRVTNSLRSADVWIVVFKTKTQTETDTIQDAYLKTRTEMIDNAIAEQERIVAEKPWSTLARNHLDNLNQTRDEGLPVDYPRGKSVLFKTLTNVQTTRIVKIASPFTDGIDDDGI
jgi:hypothetical protein